MTEETFGGNRYEIVAWARDQKSILYHEFGSYQGEWLLLAKDADTYFVYKGYYGSCSGCDSYEAEFDYNKPPTKENAVTFAKDYPSFIEIPRATMRNLLEAGTLGKVFPANIRDDYSDIDLESFVRDAELGCTLEEGLPVELKHLTNAANQELKQRALKAFGYERFVKEGNMETLDRDGENSLLRNGDIVFVYVKDSSTPRRYLLRVPPQMTTVREAIAWTFGMRPNEYRPLIET